MYFKGENVLYYALILFFIAVAFVISLYLYKKETGISKNIKAILISLRTVSLFLLLLLLLNPFFNFSKLITSKPKNIFLVDKSNSMNIENRDSIALRVAENFEEENSKFYFFSSKLLGDMASSNRDTINSFTYSTNAAGTLEELINNIPEYNINSINFISDGNFNEGNNLYAIAKSLNVPVNYRLIGDTVQKKDVLIENVLYNRKSFTGIPLEIKVRIKSFGYQSPLKVTLYEDDKILSEKELLTSQMTNDYEVKYTLISYTNTIKKYSVKCEELPGEITNKNNYESFYIKYLDSRIKILVIGVPSYDFAAFKRTFNKSNNFDISYLTEKSPDSFYENTELNLSLYDAVLLFGFPDLKTDISLVQKLSGELQRNNIALIFFNSSATDYKKLKELENYLPASIGNSGSEYISTSSVINLEALDYFIGKTIPASFYKKGLFFPKPTSIVNAVTKENEPSIIINTQIGSKSAIFAGYGIYKWDLNPQKSDNKILMDLQTVLLNSLISPENKEKFSLFADKDYYAISEPVRLTALDKTNGNNNFVKITFNNKSYSSQRLNQNTFVLETGFFIPGDYEIKADLYNENSLIATDNLRITTGESRLEYKKTYADENIMKVLALNSGGKNLSLLSTDEIKEALKIQKSSDSEVKIKILLRHSLYLLLLIILLLSLEWLIRRRYNLP